MDVFHTWLKNDIKKPYIENPDPFKDSELTFEQLLSNVNKAISTVYNQDQSNIEDMFNFYSGFPLIDTLNLMIKLLKKENLTTEDIKKFCYPEFTCAVLFTQKEIGDVIVICKAIQIFTYLLYIDDEIINLVDYVSYYLFCSDCCTNYGEVISTSIPLIGYLYTSDNKYAVSIVDDLKLINQLFKIASNPSVSIQCSNSLKLIRTMIYYSMYNDNYKIIQPEFIEKVIVKSFHYLKSSIHHVTDETLKLLQLITTDLDLLYIAKKKGLEKIIIEALGNLDNYQMSDLYIIIRNIIYFAREGKIQTTLINFKDFYTKTADLINSNVDENTFDIIISTIDLLGIVFWTDLLKQGVCGSLLLKLKDCNYTIQKRICSLLLNFFKDANSEFRREYCNEQIVEMFIRMLDDEDDEFCIELVSNLSLILASDTDFFQPMFAQFEYDEHLQDLIQNENQELSELAQTSLDNFNS